MAGSLVQELQRDAVNSSARAISPERDPVERIPHHGQVVVAGVSDSQPLALAVEKLQAEFGLQSLHLMADSPLRYAKLVCGASEVLVSRRGLKKQPVGR